MKLYGKMSCIVLSVKNDNAFKKIDKQPNIVSFLYAWLSLKVFQVSIQ